MPKFFDKTELVLLILIILMFDVNGLCEIASKYIITTDKGSIIAYLLTLSIMFYSLYLYDSICNMYELPTIIYKVSNDHSGKPTCNEITDKLKNTCNRAIISMDDNCIKPSINHGTYLAERVTFNIICVILCVLAYVSIFRVVDGDNINPKFKRFIFALPILLASCGIFTFANVYMPYYKFV